MRKKRHRLQAGAAGELVPLHQLRRVTLRIWRPQAFAGRHLRLAAMGYGASLYVSAFLAPEKGTRRTAHALSQDLRR